MMRRVRRRRKPAIAPEEARPLSFRIMKREDIPILMEIEERCFPTHWTEEALQSELNNPVAFYVVGESEGEIVGYGGEWIIMDEAHITTLAVNPALHGQRFGERLLIAMIQEARYRGARRATLEVRITNQPALGLYEKYGFDTVAIRKRYYQDTDEDALVMWMNDLFSPKVTNLLKQQFGPASEAAVEEPPDGIFRTVTGDPIC